MKAMVRLSVVLSLVSVAASSIRRRMSSSRPIARADDPDLHAVLVQIGEVAPDEAAHQAEQIVDLLLRPRPVLRREAEQSEMGDAELERGLHRAPHALHALAMTLGARQSPLAAQRPLPSMMMAICRGGRLGVRPGKLLNCKRHGLNAPIRVSGMSLRAVSPARPA